MQPKLYNPTISHDLKQNVAKGRPPTHNKAQEIHSQSETAFRQQHTFQPEINKTFRAQKEESKQERFKKLVEPKNDKILMRDQIKAQQEIEEIQKHCTFKPKLNPAHTIDSEYTNTLSGRPSSHHTRIQDRISHEVEKRRENREKIKRDIDLQEMKECSFQPKIKSNVLGGYRSQTPIHERIGDM